MQRRFMCSCKNPVLMSATLEFLLHVLLILHVIMDEFVNRPNHVSSLITAHNARQPTLAIHRLKDRIDGDRWAGPHSLAGASYDERVRQEVGEELQAACAASCR